MTIATQFRLVQRVSLPGLSALLIGVSRIPFAKVFSSLFLLLFRSAITSDFGFEQYFITLLAVSFFDLRQRYIAIVSIMTTTAFFHALQAKSSAVISAISDIVDAVRMPIFTFCPTRYATCDVLNVRDWLKVAGVNAGAPAARMVEFQPVRHWADFHFVTNNMSRPTPARTNAKLTIPQVISAANPKPTRISKDNFGVEQFGRWFTNEHRAAFASTEALGEAAYTFFSATLANACHILRIAKRLLFMGQCERIFWRVAFAETTAEKYVRYAASLIVNPIANLFGFAKGSERVVSVKHVSFSSRDLQSFLGGSRFWRKRDSARENLSPQQLYIGVLA